MQLWSTSFITFDCLGLLSWGIFFPYLIKTEYWSIISFLISLFFSLFHLFFFNLANFYNYWIYVLLCIVAFNLKYVRRKSSSLIWQTLIIWTSNNFKVNEILCYGFSGAQKIQYWWKTTDYYSLYLYPLIFLQTSYLVHGKANLELC